MLTVDTIRGAWIYTDTLADITHLDIQRAHFSSDGEWIAGVDGRNQIVLYDTVNFEQQMRLSGHRDRVVQVEWHPTDSNRLASIEEDGRLLVWDVGEGKAVFRDKVLGDIRKMLWSPTGDFLAIMDDDGSINVWDMINGTVVFSLPTFVSREWYPYAIVDFVWQGEYTLTRQWSDDGGDIEAWDILTGQEVRYARLGLQNAYGIDIRSPNGLFIAEGGYIEQSRYYPSVRIRDYLSTEVIQTLPPMYQWVGQLHWSPDGYKIAVTGFGMELLIWDVASNRQISFSTVHTQATGRVAWRDDGQIIATSGQYTEGHLWDAHTGKHLATLTGQKERIRTLAWQPKGTLLATSGWGMGASSSDDNIVQIWDTAQIDDSFEPTASFEFEVTIASVTWGLDGSNLAIIGSYRFIYIWDTNQQIITKTIDMEQSMGGCCTSNFSGSWDHSGDLLFLYGYHTEIIIDIAAPQLNGVGAGRGEAFAWTADNAFLAMKWTDCCYQHSSGALLRKVDISKVSKFANPSGVNREEWTIPLQLTFAEFDPSGQYLVGIDTNSNLVVWNLGANQQELDLNGNYNRAIWSPDSNLIAGYRIDGMGDIIHRKSGRVYITLPHANATFSPDSRRIAVVHDGVLTIYDSTPDCMASIFRPIFEGEAYCGE